MNAAGGLTLALVLAGSALPAASSAAQQHIPAAERKATPKPSDTVRASLPNVAKPSETRPNVANARGGSHIVRPGDTLLAIAQAYRVRWPEIVALNGLVAPFVLRPGQRLRLPPLPGSSVTGSGIDIEQRAAAFRIDLDTIVTGSEPAVSAIATRKSAARIALAESSPQANGFIWPASGQVASRFGPRGRGEINQGIDISVGKRAAIRAAGPGMIAFAGTDVAAYGGLILIRHAGGWMTAYGRIAEARVKRGQAVSRGEIIGYSGSGATPRLFFQMRKDRVPVDPLPQLPPR